MVYESLTEYNTPGDQRKDSSKMAIDRKNNHHKGVLGLFGYQVILTETNHRVLWASILSLLVGFWGVGCGGDQPRTEEDTQYYTDRSSAVFAPEPAPSAEPDGGISGSNAVRSGGWSIVLSTVGAGGMDRAKEMLRIINDEAGLDGAYIDERSSGLVIAYGDYLGKEDPKATKDLERVRRIELMGVKLFEAAIITPPTEKSLHGSNPLNDLRSVRSRFGDRAFYTLQVGVYGRGDYQMPSAEDLIAFRRSAEQAVRELRAQGEMAFYYHAPARSMVTIGVFGERDFDSTKQPPTMSPELRALKARFPNNLLNGQGINETVRSDSGKVTRLQASQLVNIPNK